MLTQAPAVLELRQRLIIVASGHDIFIDFGRIIGGENKANFLIRLGVHFKGQKKDVAGDVVALAQKFAPFAAERAVRVGDLDDGVFP